LEGADGEFGGGAVLEEVEGVAGVGAANGDGVGEEAAPDLDPGGLGEGNARGPPESPVEEEGGSPVEDEPSLVDAGPSDSGAEGAGGRSNRVDEEG
jgi:hypothetical protein